MKDSVSDSLISFLLASLLLASPRRKIQRTESMSQGLREARVYRKKRGDIVKLMPKIDSQRQNLTPADLQSARD